MLIRTHIVSCVDNEGWARLQQQAVACLADEHADQSF